MSEENVEIVRRGYDDFFRTGDLDPALFDPEVVFDNLNAKFDGAVYSGREGVGEYLSMLGKMWKQARFEPQGFLPVGQDQVVVPARFIAVGRDGIETVARSASVWMLRDRRVIHVKAFQTKAEALEAAGLSE
jgi:ketosteroid isomerase-like protein